MTDPLVERVAKVLWDNSLLKPYHLADIKPATSVPVSGPDWQRFIPVARKVIKAMREPSDKMAETGSHSSQWDSAFTARTEISDEARSVWNAMIDAALGEE